jgi:L-lactate dehydrogenase complex protein LldG
MAPISQIARAEILGRVRASLGRAMVPDVPPVPASARIPSRIASQVEAELDVLLAELVELGGHVRSIASSDDLGTALAELVAVEQIERATMWQTPELQALGLAERLAPLGVQVVAPDADKRQIATCDLGITGVDAALPETGTLVLRSGPERPRMASLVPRVHLALLKAACLRADLAEALAECRGTSCLTLITGPSRTSDIELTLTIGVHGPKALYVWLMAGD